MKQLYGIVFFLLVAPGFAYAQAVSINTDGSNPATSAILDVKSTDKGVLVPRMTGAQRAAIAAPATGLLVFDTNTGGFWFYNGAAWTSLSAPNNLQDADGNTKVQVEKNPNEDIIRFDLGGTERLVLRQNAGGTTRLELFNTNLNTAVGANSLVSNTTGSANTANGWKTMFSNTTGDSNTGNGTQALFSNTTGSGNTATGALALSSNTTAVNNTGTGAFALKDNTGSENTAHGAYALNKNNTGIRNTASGVGALEFNTSGYNNVADGFWAMRNNTTGAWNTGTGFQSLYSNTTGIANVAVGPNALFSNTTAAYNVAVGDAALVSNTSGSSNVALGKSALFNNTNSSNLVAVGDSALYNNGLGAIGPNEAAGNTAVGSKALFSNSTGTSNTGIGRDALYHNSTGGGNTAIGVAALVSNTTGIFNTASGEQALAANTSGSENTSSGFDALIGNTSGSFNTAMGDIALGHNATGSYNTAIGRASGPNSGGYNNTTCLGTDATATGSDMVRVGNTFVTSIGGQVGWTTLSDGRFKENVEANVPGLAFITLLRPVTYRLNRRAVNDFTGVSERKTIGTDLRNEHTPLLSGAPLSEPTTGFIAQEVEKAARELGFDFSGVDKPKNDADFYGLRYAEFTVPLVKAVQEQQAMISQLQQENAALKAKLDTQSALLQKITAALQTAGIGVEEK